MEELQKVFAGPVTKVFGGRSLEFAQFTFDMLVEFERWAEKRWKAKQADAAAEMVAAIGLDGQPDLSPFDRAKIIAETRRDCREPFDLLGMMQSLPGMLHALLLSVRVKHTDLTEAALGALLPFDPNVLTSLVNELQPTGPETAEEIQQKEIQAARQRLEGAIKFWPADEAAECKLRVEDAIKMLYDTTGEIPEGAPADPPEPAGSVS